MMARIFGFGKDLWDPSHRFQTSWLVPPYVLFGIRALLSLYAFTTLLFNIGYNCARPSLGGCETSRAAFSYFTVLSYWGLAFYFLIASIHTFSYARWSRAPLDSWPRPLQALHSLYYSTVTLFPFLVVIVFWALLSSPEALSSPYEAWTNTSQHILNSAFALFEVVVPRTNPPPWIHLPFLIILLGLYLALAYITHETKGFYTYSFLDPQTQGKLLAAYIFGIAIGVCILFAFIKGLVWLRRWITEDKLGFDGVFAHGGTRDDEERAHSGHGVGKAGEGEHEMADINPAA
ncbi:hypothetical protein GGR51DRAFT_515417 [Nemania sp. FL0031]|nr:hypothetical protein GGR51DRAFT_515417 [Nemania sp. FL0031]